MKQLLIVLALLVSMSSAFAQPKTSRLEKRYYVIHNTPVELELWALRDGHQLRVYIDSAFAFEVYPIAGNFSEIEMKRLESWLKSLSESEFDSLTDGSC